ncbi:MAG: hypothetical protein ACXVCX_16370 [Ktedonobacterales bacterium]
MAEVRAPIAIGLAQGRSKPLNAGRIVNLYPEQPAMQGSISPWVLYGTPGQKAWGTLGAGPIRGGKAALGFAYILSGQSLYQVDGGANAVLCTGDTIPAGGAVYMVANGTQLGMLVNSTMFYVTGTTVTKVTDADFPTEGASSLDFIDGYGVLSRGGSTGQWFLSDLLDFSSYNALNFATASSTTGVGLLRVLANHKEAWLFGDKTTEVWYDAGTFPFPFQLIPGSLIDRGIAAPLSAIRMDNAPFWLGDDRIVYRANGYQPSRVSTFPVEEILRSGTVSDAFATTHSLAGHHFYCLTLPSLGRTLVFDAATNIWHERQTGTTVTPAVWNVNCVIEAFGKTLVGTSAGGGVYELDLDTYTDVAGATQIRRVIVGAPTYDAGKRAIMRQVELECELGVGTPTGQGLNPTAMLRISRDGGQTYGNLKTQGLGPTGVRNQRAQWSNLGMGRNLVVELSMADPVKYSIYGARYEVEGLAN